MNQRFVLSEVPTDVSQATAETPTLITWRDGMGNHKEGRFHPTQDPEIRGTATHYRGRILVSWNGWYETTVVTWPNGGEIQIGNKVK